MRNALLGLIGVVILSLSTGCEIGDRMFAAHRPYGGGSCNGGGCNGGGCDSCGGGANNGGGGCANGQCGAGGQGDYAHHPLPRGEGGTYVGQEGPPTAGVAYPYYSNRGPRDFLAANPPSIGP